MTEERRPLTFRPGDVPAFPVQSLHPERAGMSKREHFAVLILAGMYASSGMVSYVEANDMVITATNQADALLEHLHKSDREVV